MSDRGPQEFAPGVYRLLVGQGALRANVYLIHAGGGPDPAAAPSDAAPSDRDHGDWVLVDTGVHGCASEIRHAADTLFGPDTPPAAILITHAHPDHVGSAAALARHWDCPVYLHPEEVRMVGGDPDHFRRHSFSLDRWLILPLLRLGGRRHLKAIMERDGLREFAAALEDDAASETHGALPQSAARTRSFLVPGLPDWEAVATPGHTPGHLVLFRARDKVLISGDSVVTKAGPFMSLVGRRPPLSRSPWYFTWNQRRARSSLLTLAELEPEVIAGGHGRPLRDTGLAARLRSMAAKR